MAGDGVRLGVDFGTSNTVAVLADGSGSMTPLLFDGSPLLASSVCADTSTGLVTGLLTGRDALHAARANPAGFEPNPKRRIDDGTVLLADAEVPVVDLIGAVLARIAGEARRVAGGTPAGVTLTCPAGWGPRRRHVLTAAAASAGLAEPQLVPEPVAAASYFVRLAGAQVSVGGCAVIYDFGAGTFDASVVRRTATGFDVLATVGLPDAGGLDIDTAIVGYLGETYTGQHAERWRRLVQPGTPADRRASRLLWDDVRTGKEMLSRTSATLIHVPLVDDDAPLGREQFEQLAQPILDRTVAATRAAVQEAEVAPDAVLGLFLVGGSSRIPLIATLLHRALRVAPIVLDHPELVVAQGSLYAPTATLLTAAAPAVGHTIVRARAPLPPRHPAGGTPLLGHSGAVQAVVFSPDGRILASGSSDCTVRLWDPIGQRPLGAPLTGHSDWVKSLSFSPDGQTLASASTDWTVRLWDVAGRCERGAPLTGHTHAVRAVAFSPDGRTLASASWDNTVRLWDVASHRQLGEPLTGHTAAVDSVAFSPDGRTLAGASLDKKIRLWDVASHRQLGEPLAGHTGWVKSVAFSPDGRTLASASTDLTIRLWDVSGHARLGDPLTGHTDVVRAVSFSPDGATLASASWDRTVRLWDTASRRPLGEPLAGHTSMVFAVSFSPDGRTLASGGRDNTVRLWARPAVDLRQPGGYPGWRRPSSLR